jgi:dihydrolipoamide dehydrogenase
MSANIYDIVVIGGGAGGVAAAIRGAQLGGNVALLEDKFLGGLCMNRGCVPFGHMLAAAHIMGRFSLAKEMGINSSGMSFDFSTLMNRQNQLVTFMRQGVEGLLRKHRVRLIKSKGKVVGRDKVETNGAILSTKKIILAAGSEWLKPDIPSNDLKEVVNSDYLLTLNELPKRINPYEPGFPKRFSHRGSLLSRTQRSSGWRKKRKDLRYT